MFLFTLASTKPIKNRPSTQKLWYLRGFLHLAERVLMATMYYHVFCYCSHKKYLNTPRLDLSWGMLRDVAPVCSVNIGPDSPRRETSMEFRAGRPPTAAITRIYTWWVGGRGWPRLSPSEPRVGCRHGPEPCAHIFAVYPVGRNGLGAVDNPFCWKLGCGQGCVAVFYHSWSRPPQTSALQHVTTLQALRSWCCKEGQRIRQGFLTWARCCESQGRRIRERRLSYSNCQREGLRFTMFVDAAQYNLTMA